jgi:heat-inducible transcriptional repressor
MRSPALNGKRNRQILSDIVRAYIESGEPVSSRALSRRSPESLSPATIRNVMSDLEEEGYLYQPHTSAGRVPTATAYRFFVQEIGSHAKLSAEDQTYIRTELEAAQTPSEIMERASHVLATMSHGLGIVVSPPMARSVLEHIRFLALPEGRLLVVLISQNGLTRDKLFRPQQPISQETLDHTAEYLNRNFAGWTLDAIRAELLARLAQEHERYETLARTALLLCDRSVLGDDAGAQVYVEGAAQIATAPEFSDAGQLRELLGAIEEKRMLVTLLTGCIEGPEPVQVQIGVKEIENAGAHLALISAPYNMQDRVQGSLGVLGPMRMQYERAITAVAYVAQLFSKELSRSDRT